MNCTEHPQESISGTCDRCGNFVCRLDSEVQPGGRTICFGCRDGHGAVDWLRDFKMELWGKRDGYAWLFGGIGVVYSCIVIAILIRMVIASPGTLAALVPVFLFAGLAGVQVAYFFGKAWAREAIIVIPLLACFVNIAVVASSGGAGSGGAPLFGIILPLVAYFDTRNKLFFKLDVPEEKLLKLWDVTRNNQLARTGFAASIIGLIVPGISLIALVCSLVGYSRVNPDSVPPIGKKGYAIAGLVISTIGILLWGTMLAVGALGGL